MSKATITSVEKTLHTKVWHDDMTEEEFKSLSSEEKINLFKETLDTISRLTDTLEGLQFVGKWQKLKWLKDMAITARTCKRELAKLGMVYSVETHQMTPLSHETVHKV